jgi:C-terminal processing protease CtpA/Prc
VGFACRLFALILQCAALWFVLIGQTRAQWPDNPLEGRFIQETVESVRTTVRKEYFDPQIAATVDRVLRRRFADGHYSPIKTLDLLASKLTQDLHELTHDKHLAVSVVRNRSDGKADEALDSDVREVIARRSNFGVQRVEIFAGNVGYLNLTAFYRPDEARHAIAAAMRTLQHADALILDVRNHGGGSPDTAALLASYFFDERRMPLFEIVPRSGEKRVYETESTDLPGRNGSRPMYVLTSTRTFSAGEGIAFLLQERERAEVIGETTAGAANPGRPYRVNDHFEVTIPNGKIRTAIRGSNWEATGVVPDVKVAADKALRVAHIRALSRLIEQTKTGARHDELQRQLDTVKAAQ